MGETWRGVLGYEDWYEVSDLGRCRSIQRPEKGGGRCWNEEYPLILTPLEYRKGYLKIQLGNCNGTRRRKRDFLHRMVWEAFNGSIKEGLTINHINGVKSDNRLANLETATQQEQATHARSLPTRRWRNGNGWSYPNITASDVKEIRRLFDSGVEGTGTMAQRYGVCQGTIRHIVTRRTWKHV